MTTDEKKASLLEQIKTELDCWSAGDTEGYGQFVADDMTYFHNVPASARLDGGKVFQDLLKALKGQVPPHKYKAENPKLQFYGDAAVYSVHYHALLPDGQLIAKARGTSVYHYTNGKWEMVHTHWSAMDDE